MTDILVLYVLLPSGVPTEHDTSDDMDASAMLGGWHVELKLSWPGFFFDYEKHFGSTLKQLQASDLNNKIAANQNGIINSFNKRAAL